VAVDVVPGQRSDDPLYLPIIDRVRASLGRTGLLYVGDSKLGPVDTRAHIHHAGDAYLCPLGKLQLPIAAVDALITQALASGSLLRISRPDADGQPVLDAHGQPVIRAEAWETSVDLTATVDGEAVTWTERRIVVRSPALQARQQQALERRLADTAYCDPSALSHGARLHHADSESRKSTIPMRRIPSRSKTRYTKTLFGKSKFRNFLTKMCPHPGDWTRFSGLASTRS
jgi:hypothetical protein